MALENGLSIADAMALANDGNGMNNFGGGWFIWIFFLFFLMWGGNWNNRGDNAAVEGAITRADLCQEFNFNNLDRAIEMNGNYMRDGFYQNGMNLLKGFDSVGQQIAENRFASQQCCCETNRNIDSLKAENYRNTCEITTALHAEGEATRQLINANTMQDLRDRLEERDRDLLQANIMASQIAQTQQLVGMLRPFPVPAYITCSPYTSSTNTCGCSTF